MDLDRHTSRQWILPQPLCAESPLLERRIAELEATAHAEAGETFCLSSPQEVGRCPTIRSLALCRLPALQTSGAHRPFTSAAPASPLRHLLALSAPPAWLQVSRILFEKLKLPPPPCAKELKSGGYSTGQEVSLGRGSRWKTKR